MFTHPCSKQLIYNEFKDFQTKDNYLDEMWNNTDIKSYLYLLNLIRRNINSNYILQEEQWNFFFAKLHFCKQVLKSLNIEKSYKKILLHNLSKDFEYFEI
tara:strand:+ start:469 stop:768 length:300 start_codon:yes stop_codon:yes gene_type:complete